MNGPTRTQIEQQFISVRSSLLRLSAEGLQATVEDCFEDGLALGRHLYSCGPAVKLPKRSPPHKQSKSQQTVYEVGRASILFSSVLSFLCLLLSFSSHVHQSSLVFGSFLISCWSFRKATSQINAELIWFIIFFQCHVCDTCAFGFLFCSCSLPLLVFVSLLLQSQNRLSLCSGVHPLLSSLFLARSCGTSVVPFKNGGSRKSKA